MRKGRNQEEKTLRRENTERNGKEIEKLIEDDIKRVTHQNRGTLKEEKKILSGKDIKRKRYWEERRRHWKERILRNKDIEKGGY